MADAHAHLDVTPEAFGRVAEHLDGSLEACGVADDDRAEVMAAVAALEACGVADDDRAEVMAAVAALEDDVVSG